MLLSESGSKASTRSLVRHSLLFMAVNEWCIQVCETALTAPKGLCQAPCQEACKDKHLSAILNSNSFQAMRALRQAVL